MKLPSAVTCHVPVPAAEAYCTDQPPSSTAVAPRLYNSTKSFLNVEQLAAEQPAPP